ncbi:MAG: MerR family transcriptional regulator [Desulfobacteraceae bacterium]
MKNQKQIYSIGKTAKIRVVSEKQISRWEDKQHFPELDRVIYGKRTYRQFSNADFTIIDRINHYLEKGCILAPASKKAGEEIINKKEEN